MEDEMPFGELVLVCPDGRSCTRWTGRANVPVPLFRTQGASRPQPGDDRPRHQQLYLVGDPATGFIAIDPGRGTHSTSERLCGAPPGATSA